MDDAFFVGVLKGIRNLFGDGEGFIDRNRPLSDALGQRVTFHQFHGGVATNVPRAEHPWARMAAEYEAIRGKPYANEATRPDYAGWLSPRYHAALMP